MGWNLQAKANVTTSPETLKILRLLLTFYRGKEEAAAQKYYCAAAFLLSKVFFCNGK